MCTRLILPNMVDYYNRRRRRRRRRQNGPARHCTTNNMGGGHYYYSSSSSFKGRMIDVKWMLLLLKPQQRNSKSGCIYIYISSSTKKFPPIRFPNTYYPVFGYCMSFCTGRKLLYWPADRIMDGIICTQLLCWSNIQYNSQIDHII